MARAVGLLVHLGATGTLILAPRSTLIQGLTRYGRALALGALGLGMTHGVAAALAYRSWRVFMPTTSSLPNLIERGGVMVLATLTCGLWLFGSRLASNRRLGAKALQLGTVLAAGHALLIGSDLQGWLTRALVVALAVASVVKIRALARETE